MDTTKFETFRQLCFRELPDEIDKILNAAKDEEACAIGFITTDDFYGIYLAWDYSHNINEYYEWKHGLEPDFLYQPLVDIVEDCKDIDFCNPSDEKWEFAQTLLSVLEKSIRQIPDGVFEKNGFKREDILFFSTMSDGDYIQEMMDTSVKMFNTSETLERYHLNRNGLKIALLQIAPCNTLAENLEKGIRYCIKAKERGADIALFPEMWSNGYNIYDRPVSEWKAEAVLADSDFVHAFGNLAKELHMAIGITLLEKHENGPRNSLILFDRFGERKLIYAKVHTCDFDVERNLTPGEDFYVTTLDTASGEVKVGAMICYDREFPESARILMLKGAELILVPNACPMEINRLSQLRARAYENMTAIATCNYPESVPDCNGGSSVFDGVAYLPELDHSRDTCILQADGQEGIYIAELDLEQLRNYRRREVHGNSFRHPKKYGLLIDTKIEDPFRRKNYRE